MSTDREPVPRILVVDDMPANVRLLEAVLEPAGFAADDALARWVQRGLDFVSGLPVKPVRTSR